MRPSPSASLQRPMTTQMREMAEIAPAGRLFPDEVLARGAVSHDNFTKFVTKDLFEALRHVLRGNPDCARLLDRLETADNRIARQLANNQSGANYSAWAPGARDAYRRELTVGHYMTAVADELASLSKIAAHCAPSTRQGRDAQRVEKALLHNVAAFLNEFKRSVRSESIVHVNQDYSKEEARRYDCLSRDGKNQPSQETISTQGASLRGGLGLTTRSPVKLGLTGSAQATTTARRFTDYDRDINQFEETTGSFGLDATAGITGLNASVGISLDVASGHYYEGVNTEATAELANLARYRHRDYFGVSRSAGKHSRQISEQLHGLSHAARKLIGGGRNAPYDSIRWAGARKEEIGKYNRTALQTLAASIERDVQTLWRLRGAGLDAASPQPGLAAAAKSAFPSMADQLTRASQQLDSPAIATAIGRPSEVRSAPAMPPKRGAPWLKEPYRSVTVGASANATVGFLPLATASGRVPAGVKRALNKVIGLAPSASVNLSASHNRRELPLERQGPTSDTLAPVAAGYLPKGIAKVDETALALHRRLPAARAAAHPDMQRDGRVDDAAPVDYTHPAYAVLRRYESDLYKARYACQGRPYIATIGRLLESGDIDSTALITSVDARLASLEAGYIGLLKDAHGAKEAKSRGDVADFAACISRIERDSWAGWNRLPDACSRRQLDAFIGHSIAQHLLALTRLKYEATLAKQHISRCAAATSATQRDAARDACLRADRRFAAFDEIVREVKPPLLQDTMHGYGFYTANGLSARKMTTATCRTTASAGLAAGVSSAIGGAATFSTLRGPELQLTATQVFNHVTSHPNLLRTGQFYTLTLSVKAGASFRTLVTGGEAAIREAERKGRIAPAFARAIKDKLAADIAGAVNARGDTLVFIGRSGGAALELSYGAPPPLGNESPSAWLRYMKVLGQTSYDNSVRGPNVLLATGTPGTLAPGAVDVTSMSRVLGCRHGQSVRHLLLEYAGPGGLKAVLNPRGDEADIDFEAARAALLEPGNASLLEGWFHRRSPVVDVVERYLQHRARALPTADDEFDYIDLEGDVTRDVDKLDASLKHFAAGSGADPFAPCDKPGRRESLRRQAAPWAGQYDATAFADLRARLASLHTDAERVDFLTREPAGQALLQQAVAVLDAYGTWAASLRTVLGYPGRPNDASIDQLRLKPPAGPKGVNFPTRHRRPGSHW